MESLFKFSSPGKEKPVNVPLLNEKHFFFFWTIIKSFPTDIVEDH